MYQNFSIVLVHLQGPAVARDCGLLRRRRHGELLHCQGEFGSGRPHVLDQQVVLQSQAVGSNFAAQRSELKNSQQPRNDPRRIRLTARPGTPRDARLRVRSPTPHRNRTHILRADIQSERNETHGYTGSFVSMLGTARTSTCKTHAASNGGFQSCSFDILQSFHLIVIGRLGALRCLPVCGSAPRRNQQTCRSRRERLHNLWRRRAGLLRTMLSRSSRRLQPTCLNGFFFEKSFSRKVFTCWFSGKRRKNNNLRVGTDQIITMR